MTVSEVKKLITRYSRDFDGNLTIDPNGPWVLAEEARIWAKRQHDEAQSELTALKAELASEEQDHAELRDVVAALREELAELEEEFDTLEHSNVTLKLSLTAAEQRIADLCGLLVRTLPVVRMVGRQDHLCDYAMDGSIQAEIETTLNPKPAESGASE